MSSSSSAARISAGIGTATVELPSEPRHCHCQNVPSPMTGESSSRPLSAHLNAVVSCGIVAAVTAVPIPVAFVVALFSPVSLCGLPGFVSAVVRPVVRWPLVALVSLLSGTSRRSLFALVCTPFGRVGWWSLVALVGHPSGGRCSRRVRGRRPLPESGPAVVAPPASRERRGDRLTGELAGVLFQALQCGVVHTGLFGGRVSVVDGGLQARDSVVSRLRCAT